MKAKDKQGIRLSEISLSSWCRMIYVSFWNRSIESSYCKMCTIFFCYFLFVFFPNDAVKENEGSKYFPFNGVIENSNYEWCIIKAMAAFILVET